MENDIMHDRLLDHSAATDFPASSFGQSLWEIIWQRKAYVALGAVVGLALGVLYWSMAPKTYESSAQLLVVKKRPDAPISAPASSPTGAVTPSLSEDFLDTHQTVIRSAVVLGGAVAKGHLSDRATFQASDHPTRDLARSLTVGRDRDKSAGRQSTSQILNISFRCGHSEDCGPILGAVIDSYCDFLSNSTQGSVNEALKLITKARDLVQNDLESKQKAYAEFRRNTPVLWKTSFGTTMYQERLANLDAQRAALGVRMARVRATLDAVEDALKQGRSRADLLEIVSALPGHTPVAQETRRQRTLTNLASGEGMAGGLANSLEQELIQLQLEEGKLLEDYGPEHPRVKSLRDRMQTLRGLLAPSTTPEAKTTPAPRKISSI
jgi:succinoglycan biosynthesis transport protein ExoP